MTSSRLDAPVRPGRRRWTTLLRDRGRLLALAGTALAIELVLVLGFLLPLSIARTPDVINTDRPLATVLGTDGAGALRYAVPVVCAFALFALAVHLARGLTGRACVVVVLLGAVVFAGTLVPTNPLGAHDIYHNVADARTVWRYHDNPTLLPPNAYPDDPFYPNVAAWRDFPSVYGPVWYVVSGAPLPFTGDGLWSNVIGQKVLTALFLVGTAALTMLAAGRIRPAAMIPAGILVGWNPLLLFETAGNAHNDVVMVFFAVAALYAVTRRWWYAVFPLLALSVAAKFFLILLGPVLLMWMLRRRDVPRRAILLSLGLGAVVGLAVYVPFYAGPDTLAAVQRQTGYTTSSPAALLEALLWGKLGMGLGSASTLMRAAVMPAFFVAYLLIVWRIPRDAGLVALVRACFWTVFLLLAIATWWFWPWYLLSLMPLAALLPGSRPALIGMVFSACAMLMYVPYFWLLFGDGVLLQAATAGTAFLLPVLIALTPRFRRGGEPAMPAGALAGD